MFTQLKTLESESGRGGVNPAAVTGEGRQYLVFKEGIFTLALKIEAIKKLHDAQTIPPRTPGTRMLDLQDLTGAETEVTHGYWIEMEVGSHRYLMPVEEVEGIRELSLAVVMDYPPALQRPDVNYMPRIFFDGLRMIVELDPQALADMIEGRAGSFPPRPGAHERGKDKEKVSGGRGGKSADPKRPGERIVIFFEAGSHVWSLDLEQVLQITNRDEIHPVPAFGRKIGGVAYHAEQAVPVLSPGTLARILLGSSDSGDDDFSLIIVMETTKGLLGLGCSRIIQVAKNVSPDQGKGTGDPVAGSVSGRPTHGIITEKLLQYLV